MQKNKKQKRPLPRCKESTFWGPRAVSWGSTACSIVGGLFPSPTQGGPLVGGFPRSDATRRHPSPCICLPSPVEVDGADLGIGKVSLGKPPSWPGSGCWMCALWAHLVQMLTIWVGLERPAYLEKKRGASFGVFFFFPDLTPPPQHLGAHLAFLARGSGGAGKLAGAGWC